MEYTEPSSTSQESRNGNGVVALAARAEEKVRELGSTAQQHLENSRAKVADGIEDAASKVRGSGETAGSVSHNAGETVAVRMEAAADYLHEHRTNEIAGDLGSYIRAHPIRSMIVAALLGFLFGRLFG